MSLGQSVAIHPQYEEEKLVAQCNYESEYKYGTNKEEATGKQKKSNNRHVQNSDHNQSIIGQNLYEPSNQSFQFGPGNMYQSNQEIFLKSNQHS